MARQDPFGTDLRLTPTPQGGVDVAGGTAGQGSIDGLDNLVQSLTLRLLTHQGELADLGHPRFGSRVWELIGEPLDAANLGLLRRYVRQAVLADPNVAEITRLDVTPRLDAPGAVDVFVAVRAAPPPGAEVVVRVVLDAG
jgi:phage baseplate assembly protein W